MGMKLYDYAMKLLNIAMPEFEKEGIKIVYFPYTKGISSTKITEALHAVRGWTKETETSEIRINTDLIN